MEKENKITKEEYLTHKMRVIEYETLNVLEFYAKIKIQTSGNPKEHFTEYFDSLMEYTTFIIKHSNEMLHPVLISKNEFQTNYLPF